MKTKTAKVLPKISSEIQNGGLYIQRVRCGKQNCKCARGETHSAYYFFTRRNGKVVKFYVRKADVKAFSKLVERASLGRAKEKQLSQSSRVLLKRLRESVRESEVLTKLYKQIYKYENS
jgi:hypothetical protein